MDKNFKYLHIRVNGNKKSIPVLMEVDEEIKLGDYVFVEDIEDSWPVHKISYSYFPKYPEEYTYKFTCKDLSKPRAVLNKSKTYRKTYAELKYKEFIYKNHRYLCTGTKDCILKSIKGGEVIDLDSFTYHGLEMYIKSFEFGLYTDHKLGGVKVSDNNPYYTYENNILFNKDKTKIIMYLGNAEEVIIPETVKEIGSGAFILADELKTIKFKGFIKNIEEYSFVNCKSLTDIVFEKGVYLFYLEYFDNCPSLEYVKCNYNELSITKGTIYINDVICENGCYYTKCDENPYYFLSDLVDGYDDEPEDIYEFPEDYDETLPEWHYVDPAEFIVLKAEDQVKKEYIVNNRVVAFSKCCLNYDRCFAVSYDNKKELYFNIQIRNFFTYYRDIIDLFSGNSGMDYKILTNTLKNLDLFPKVTSNDVLNIIEKIQNISAENHINYIVKYKEYNEINELCYTGLLRLDDALILYIECYKKRSIDKNIILNLDKYISNCYSRMSEIEKYSKRNVFISKKIVDCNIKELKELFMHYEARLVEDLDEAEFVILGEYDNDILDYCNKSAIKTISSSKFSAAVKNERS